LRAAARDAPADALAALALGRALRRAGHSTEALGELRRGLAIAGKVETRLDLSWEVVRVHADRRDFVQALAACKPVGSLPGAAAEGHACAAVADLVRQRATEALDETGLALARDPRCYAAKVAEGRAHELELDASKAEVSLRDAIALRADHADALVILGRVLLKEGRREDGIASLRDAVRLDPNGPDALYELASNLPQGAESTALFDKATRERPTFLEAWVALGTAQLAAGHVGDAKKAAEAAVRIDPKSAAAYVILGKIALLEGRTDDAIRAGQSALAILANNAAAKLIVADGDARKGDIDAALEAYQAAWGLDHGDPAPLVHASEACHAAGRDTSARAFGVKATQEFPKWAPGWAALGDALAAQGEAQAARDAYRKALASDGLSDAPGIQRKLASLK
jgi:tetratricopeptide (TPR) repeat protein